MYRVNGQRVASETLDGEVVILDQVVGTYYSLGGSGADVWEMLVTGASAESIVTAMAARFEGDPRQIAEAVRGLVDELARDGLLDEVADAAGPAVDDQAHSGARRAWAAPRLERFTDLQSRLLLDPIHDVDASGWPHPPTPAP